MFKCFIAKNRILTVKTQCYWVFFVIAENIAGYILARFRVGNTEPIDYVSQYGTITVKIVMNEFTEGRRIVSENHSNIRNHFPNDSVNRSQPTLTSLRKTINL